MSDKGRVMDAVMAAFEAGELRCASFARWDNGIPVAGGCVMGVAMFEAMTPDAFRDWITRGATQPGGTHDDWAVIKSVLGVGLRDGIRITANNDRGHYELAIALLEAAIPEDLTLDR